MPTYDYYCKNCEYQEERFFQSISKAEESQFCPKCQKEMIKMIGTGEHTIFRGDGFYENDYKRNKDAMKELERVYNEDCENIVVDPKTGKEKSY